MKIGGTVMILMGILLFTDQMTQITIWLKFHYAGMAEILN